MDSWVTNRQFSLSAFNSVTITGSVNNIVTTTPPMPGLTQDDSSVPYCNAKQLPSGCNATTLCSCPHINELQLNKVYDFIFLDADGKTFRFLDIWLNNERIVFDGDTDVNKVSIVCHNWFFFKRIFCWIVHRAWPNHPSISFAWIFDASSRDWISRWLWKWESSI